MAVRAFDVTDPRSTRLTVVEPAPRRRDRRRATQRWAALGALSLVVPFAAAIIVLGVTH